VNCVELIADSEGVRPRLSRWLRAAPAAAVAV